MGQTFKQMPNANSDLEKNKTLSSIFQNSKTKSCQLRLLCSRFRIQNPKYFLHIDIFLFLCTTRHYCFVFQKKFQVFFSTCFFSKKTFSGIFFYLNSTKCNCGL